MSLAIVVKPPIHSVVDIKHFFKLAFFTGLLSHQLHSEIERRQSEGFFAGFVELDELF